MRIKVLGIALLVVLIGGGGLFGYTRARSETDRLQMHLQHLQQRVSTTTIPAWSTPTEDFVLPTKGEALTWLMQASGSST